MSSRRASSSSKPSKIRTSVLSADSDRRRSVPIVGRLKLQRRRGGFKPSQLHSPAFSAARSSYNYKSFGPRLSSEQLGA